MLQKPGVPQSPSVPWLGGNDAWAEGARGIQAQGYGCVARGDLQACSLIWTRRGRHLQGRRKTKEKPINGGHMMPLPGSPGFSLHASVFI